jgi:LacI family transcriptional regulator
LVFPQFGRIGDLNGYFSSLLNGVMSATFQSEYGLTICPELSKSSANGLINDGRFDGLLWCKPDYSAESAASIQRSEVPIVMMHAPHGDGPDVPRFCCDNKLGLKLAVDHLVGLGHRRIGFLTDQFNYKTAEGRERAAAFGSAMSEHDLPTEDKDYFHWSFECSELAQLSRGSDGPTALVAFSERHAASLLQSAEALGISVPSELSVVGFDSSTFCDTTRPRLTSISQPIEKMAFDATQTLISYIQADTYPTTPFIYPCGFDVRESTAEPRA